MSSITFSSLSKSETLKLNFAIKAFIVFSSFLILTSWLDYDTTTLPLDKPENTGPPWVPDPALRDKSGVICGYDKNRPVYLITSLKLGLTSDKPAQ